MRNITIKNLFFSLSIIVCAFTASAVGRSTQPVDVDDAGRSLRMIQSKGALLRVKDKKVVDEASEIRSRPYPIRHKSHAYRAMEAGAEYVETSFVLGDAFDIRHPDWTIGY